MGNDDLTEPLKKRVGGSLSRLPPLQRLEMLRRNALMLRGGKWSPLKMMEPSFEKLLVLREHSIPYASKQSLIAWKSASVREKDLRDAMALRRLLEDGKAFD